MSKEKATHANATYEEIEQLAQLEVDWNAAGVAAGHCSTKITGLIVAWMKESERQALRQLIIEGCHDMDEIYLETARVWESADDELWRRLEP